MVELIISCATFAITLLLTAAAAIASLAVAVAALLRYGDRACLDGG